MKLCDSRGQIPPTCAAHIDGLRSGMRAYRLFIASAAKEPAWLSIIPALRETYPCPGSAEVGRPSDTGRTSR